MTPIFLLIILLFGLKWPLTKAGPAVFFYTLLLTWFKWNVSASILFGVLSKAGLLTLDVMIILFGAIFFLDYLRATNLIIPIQEKLSKLSNDKRVQALLVAWLFGNFLEGISGFGTPAAIVASIWPLAIYPCQLSIINESWIF